jgi:tripartite-type tricarboxylate transporter receptor subunit TctC
MKVQRPVLPALTRFLVLLMALTQISSLHAQSYPSKAIRLIIPFAPGGSTDIVGRMLAARLSEVLGKTSDNRQPGREEMTIIGTELAANAAPDGYTLVIATSSHASNPGMWQYYRSPDL